jgi:hypothetical protein
LVVTRDVDRSPGATRSSYSVAATCRYRRPAEGPRVPGADTAGCIVPVTPYGVDPKAPVATHEFDVEARAATATAGGPTINSIGAGLICATRMYLDAIASRGDLSLI